MQGRVTVTNTAHNTVENLFYISGNQETHAKPKWLTM